MALKNVLSQAIIPDNKHKLLQVGTNFAMNFLMAVEMIKSKDSHEPKKISVILGQLNTRLFCFPRGIILIHPNKSKIDGMIWHTHQNYSSIYLKVQQYRFSVMTLHISHFNRIFTVKRKSVTAQHAHAHLHTSIEAYSISEVSSALNFSFCISISLSRSASLNQVQLCWGQMFI